MKVWSYAIILLLCGNFVTAAAPGWVERLGKAENWTVNTSGSMEIRQEGDALEIFLGFHVIDLRRLG